MTERDSNETYDELVRSIKEAAQKSLHSSVESVSENMSKHSNEDIDTAAVKEDVTTHTDPDNTPTNTTLSSTPAETAVVDQSAAERSDTLTLTAGNNRGRKIVAGGALLALVLGAGAYLGLGGKDKPDQGGSNAQPTATAKANTGGTKVVEHAPITTPLDSSVDTSIVPLTQNQFDLLNRNFWPNAVEKTLAANIDARALEKLMDKSFFRDLVAKNPNWDALYSIYQNYGTDIAPHGMPQAIASPTRSFINNIYNNVYTAEAQFYSQPQNFRSPKTAGLIGKAPFAKISEFNTAAQKNDFATLFNKFYPANTNYIEAFVGELEAGNTDPVLVDQFTNLSMFGNEVIGNIGSGPDIAPARTIAEATTRTTYDTLYQDYINDPKKFRAKHSLNTNRHITMISTKMLDASRQLIGVDAPGPDRDTENTVASAIVYQEYTVSGSDDTENDGKYESVTVLAWYGAPTKGAHSQAVFPVKLEQASQRIAN